MWYVALKQEHRSKCGLCFSTMWLLGSTSMSLLPCSAKRLIRKVLMDLLRSRALSVPTSSLHYPIASSANDSSPVDTCEVPSLHFG